MTTTTGVTPALTAVHALPVADPEAVMPAVVLADLSRTGCAWWVVDAPSRPTHVAAHPHAA